MAKIGYARVSSKEQNLDRQLQALQGVSKVFSDKLSGQSRSNAHNYKLCLTIFVKGILLLLLN